MEESKQDAREPERPGLLEERELLGGLFVDPDRMAEVQSILSPLCIVDPVLRRVYEAMLRMHEHGIVFDLRALTEQIWPKGPPPGMSARLARILVENAPPSSAHVLYYARRLRVRECLSRAQHLGVRIARDAADVLPEVEAAQRLIDEASESLFAIQPEARVERQLGLGDGVAETFHQIMQARNSPNHIVGIPTRLHDFDAATGGLRAGDLIVIAARPSMGKTSLALSMIRGAVDRPDPRTNKRPRVLFASVEMGRMGICARFLAAEANLAVDRLLRGMMDDREAVRLQEAVHTLRDLPILIDESSDSSIGALRAKARREKQKREGLDLLVVDYLQLLHGPNSESRQVEVSAVSRGLKAIARELEIPVVALSQLSRKCEERTNKRPMLSDLRESGSIEQDADVVAFLYRDALYDQNVPHSVAELIIAKQRQGALKTVRLEFDPRRTRFRDAPFAPAGAQPVGQDAAAQGGERDFFA